MKTYIFILFSLTDIYKICQYHFYGNIGGVVCMLIQYAERPFLMFGEIKRITNE